MGNKKSKNAANNPGAAGENGVQNGPNNTVSQDDGTQQHDGGGGNVPDRYHKRDRRASVSGETVNPHTYTPVVHAKDEETKVRVRAMVRECNKVLFANLEEDTINRVVDAMFPVDMNEGDDIISQGAEGDNFYLVESGECDIFVSRDESGPQKVMTAGPGRSFGELALMYLVPRAATVRCKQSGKLWALDRVSFQNLIIAGTDANTDKNNTPDTHTHEKFLDNVPVLAPLNKYERLQLAECMIERRFESGDTLIRQGDGGDEMCVLVEGQCGAYIHPEGKKRKIRARTYNTPGDYFGELAPMNADVRKATIIADTDGTLLFIQRADFDRLLGPVKPALQRHAEQYRTYEELYQESKTRPLRAFSHEGMWGET
eukprot:GDKI01016144.1.p1 GENE.GDKI01016144.1~~GDKI01016144.1.p1  ORF type:complete len:396 (-),score=73.44 GDKI01016144.1:172-1287(-)